MAVAGVKISWNSPDLDQLRKDLAALADPRTNAEVLKAALRKAIKPPLDRLKQITPVGPTGNLRRAVSSKVKSYPNGGAVGLVGYERSARGESASAQGGRVRSGKDRAFHQWFIEFGTKPRVISKFSNKRYERTSPKTDYTRVRMGVRETVRGRGVLHWVSGQNSYIASSFNSLGGLKGVFRQGGRMVTDPPYPNAYFKKSKTPIVIPPTPAGGVAGVPPVRSAFESTQPQVAEILTRELRISLQRAWDALTVRDTGSITGV